MLKKIGQLQLTKTIIFDFLLRKLKVINLPDRQWLWQRRLMILTVFLSILTGALATAQVLMTLGHFGNVKFIFNRPIKTTETEAIMFLITGYGQDILVLLLLIGFFIFSVHLFNQCRTERWDRSKGKAAFFRLLGLLIYLIIALVTAYIIL